jgi:hypothetical protein
MRTINEIVGLVKAEDCETSVTANFIRRLCKTSAIPFVRAGNRLLVDFDAFLNYLRVRVE